MAVNDPTTRYGWAIPDVNADNGIWGVILREMFAEDGATGATKGIDQVVGEVEDKADAAQATADEALAASAEGRRAYLDGWTFENVPADAVAKIMRRFNSAFVDPVTVMPRAGTVTALMFQLSAVPTGGSVTLKLFKNGADAGAQVGIDSAFGARIRTTTISVAFVAGDTLSLRVVGSGDLSPSTLDVGNSGFEVSG